jgi:hypothetical protein
MLIFNLAERWWCGSLVGIPVAAVEFVRLDREGCTSAPERRQGVPQGLASTGSIARVDYHSPDSASIAVDLAEDCPADLAVPAVSDDLLESWSLHRPVHRFVCVLGVSLQGVRGRV